jgi:anti-anti-sigma factor
VDLTLDRHQDGADGTVRLVVRGELDLTTGERVDRALRDAERGDPATLVLDLTGVDFFDSTGLQILLDADVRARADGRRLVVRAGDGEVARVLALTDVSARLHAAQVE